VKSHENSLCEIAICIYRDAMAMCAANESTVRDIETLVSRVEDEGLSFLTITLPAFGQDFERSLDRGFIDPKCFRSFRKYRRIPAFLRGIVGQIFDVDTGGIRNDPPIESIKAVRQIAFGFKKIKLACTPKRVCKAYAGYISDELDLKSSIAPEDVSIFEDVCNHMWDFMATDPLLDSNSWLPRHGPGATAERISGNQKYVIRSWHDRLEPYFPLTQYAYASAYAYESKEFDSISIVSESDEMPVRVITVPKTLKSPRLIAVEPVCMQYTQQALARSLMRCLERAPISAGHVNFTDQSVNQSLAISSSRTGRMATLDLSSASDRVPLSLVSIMLKYNQDFLDAALACRSKNAKLPSGEVIHLRKFASMGSALCFPIESMYFYTLCVVALLEIQQLPVTYTNVLKCSRDVYVYGDDIVVPAHYAAAVTTTLQKYYCRVNATKSFWTGKFRESCGMDAFNGTCVTPTYLRELPPSDRRETNALISWVETANLFNEAGYFLTSSYLFSRCERYLGHLPTIPRDSGGLGHVSLDGSTSPPERMNPHTHVPEVRTWVPSPIYRKDKLDGYAALQKCLLSLERRFSSPARRRVEIHNVDSKHLSRHAQYGAVTLKRRWVPA